MIIGWSGKIIAALYSNRKPGEVAAAVSMALLLTLVPGANLLWIALFILMFFVRINQAVALVFLAILAPFSSFADPLLHRLGYAVLTHAALSEFFTSLYSVPLMSFTRFNNTLVMGGLTAGLILWFPLFFLARIGVLQLRLHLIPSLAAGKTVKALTRIPLVAKLAGAIRHWASIYQAMG